MAMERGMHPSGVLPEHLGKVLEFRRPQIDEGVSVSEAQYAEWPAEEIPTHLLQGKVVAGHDVVDWTLEVPEDLQYYGMATFVPGYLGIKQSSREPRKRLAQEGIAALSYSPSRDGDESRLASFRDPQLLHVKTLGAIAADLRERQLELARTIPNGNRIDVDQKLLVLHSMGGLAGPRYALQESAAVEAIVGYATVGLGHPTLPELAIDIPAGIIGSARHELIPAFKSGAIEINLRNLRDVVRYYSRLRVIFEGISCLRDDMTENILDLANRGIPYHYVAFGRDILVRGDNGITPYVSSFSTMENYGHLAPQVKAAKVAKKAAALALAA